MSDGTRISFEGCDLLPALRELRVRGQAVAVAPKAFDLIVLLVERRQRVVTKDELQAALWPGQEVSDGAIARTVMLARRALGQPLLIKTVQGLGYRFQGKLAADDAPAPPPLRGGALRLGFLPFDNRTGDRRLDWIELGMAAMAVQAMDADPVLSVRSLPEMLAALAGLSPDAGVSERAASASATLQLQACVHAVLRRQASALWLDYRIFGSEGAPQDGSLRGDEPVELGELLARTVRNELAPGGAARVGLVSQDPFVNQAYARAAQLQALHQFRAAARLLAVVVEFEPRSLAARLALVLAMANLEDPGTDAEATELARLAAQRQDRATQAKALMAAGGALVLGESAESLPLADQRLAAALQAASPHAAESWAVRIRLVSARVAMLRGDLDAARALCRTVQDATAADNGLQQALTLDALAEIELASGQRLRALGLYERSLALHLKHRLRSTAALTAMNLARVSAELGLMSRALEQAQLSESLFEAVQQPHVAASVAEAAAMVYSEARALAALDRVLQRLATKVGLAAVQSKSAWQLAMGLRAAADGDWPGARQHLGAALARARAQPAVLRETQCLQWLLEVESRTGEPDALATLQTEARALLTVRDDCGLRAALLLSQARAHQQSNHLSAAWAALQEVIALGRPGRHDAMARLQAVPLLAALGRQPEVVGLLAPIGTWLDEHPAGREVAAAQARPPP